MVKCGRAIILKNNSNEAVEAFLHFTPPNAGQGMASEFKNVSALIQACNQDFQKISAGFYFYFIITSDLFLFCGAIIPLNHSLLFSSLRGYFLIPPNHFLIVCFACLTPE